MRLEARRRYEPPTMQLGDLITRELVGVPPRVAKSVSSIKPMPMPYDLLPTEMRARTAKERQERRRRKKKGAETSQPGARERSQSSLHWTWEPSLSDTQISLSSSGTHARLRRRTPKKPVFAKPAMVVDTEEDRTEMLRRLQERQVMVAERTNVAIMATRSARECEIKSNTFTPATKALPEFYIDRLVLDGERKPGQSRVDCRRRRKRRVAQAIGRQWSIPKSAWSDDATLQSGRGTAAAGTATTARQNRWMATEPAPEPEPEIEPEPPQSAMPRKASPITVIPQVVVESQDTGAPHTQAPLLGDTGERISAGSPAVQVPEPKLASGASNASINAGITGAISPPKEISHQVGPPGLEIPAGWECGSVGAASYRLRTTYISIIACGLRDTCVFCIQLYIIFIVVLCNIHMLYGAGTIFFISMTPARSTGTVHLGSMKTVRKATRVVLMRTTTHQMQLLSLPSMQSSLR